MEYECRYDPKYASQYKSKHTKHVKLSKKIRFPLDTQKEYLNCEWPRLEIFIINCDDKPTRTCNLWVAY
jgi:hypothetical protein